MILKMGEITLQSINNAPQKKSDVIFLIGFMGILAAIFMYWITAQGPGVSPDSVVYIEVARNLLDGKGFFAGGEAMTHYPPLFPLILALIGYFTGGDVLDAAHLLVAFLFGINFILFSLAVQMCTRYSLVAVFCTFFLFFFSTAIISIHEMVWSEAPFITFSMMGLLLIAYHLNCPKFYWLFLASFLLALATVTRYVGIALFPTIALAYLLLDTRDLKRRLVEFVALCVIGLLPLLLWVIRNILIAQSATNRSFSVHFFNADHAKNLIVYLYDFLLPIPISEWIKGLHIGLFAIIFYLAARYIYIYSYHHKKKLPLHITALSILMIYNVIYIFFLVISISFFDAHTPMDYRILLPFLLVMAVVIVGVFKSLSEIMSERSIWYGCLFFLFFSFTINAIPAISTAINMHHNGNGYTARYWRESAALAYLSSLPKSVKIYSNGPDIIHFLVRREAIMVPVKIFTGTRQENKNYGEQIKKVIQECEKEDSLIAYLYPFAWRWYLPSQEEIESMLGGDAEVIKFEDGIIYRFSKEKNHSKTTSSSETDMVTQPSQ